jgi:hypothetical protein
MDAYGPMGVEELNHASAQTSDSSHCLSFCCSEAGLTTLGKPQLQALALMRTCIGSLYYSSVSQPVHPTAVEQPPTGHKHNECNARVHIKPNILGNH